MNYEIAYLIAALVVLVINIILAYQARKIAKQRDTTVLHGAFSAS